MKSITQTFAVALLFAASALSFKANAKTGGILTMRTSEVMNGNWDNSITIVDESGQVEQIDLKKLKPSEFSRNLIIINATINKIKDKGYKLIATSQGNSEGLVMMTYTFEKQ